MPSRAKAPFLQYWRIFSMVDKNQVSMPSRACAPFLLFAWILGKAGVSVSMPFRAETPFLQVSYQDISTEEDYMYQCPFGLMLHFYANTTEVSTTAVSSINALSG